MKYSRPLCLTFVIVLIFGCTPHDPVIDVIDKRLLTSEKVTIYNSDLNDILKRENNSRALLDHFPFISNNPIIDFHGKFSDPFYDKIPYRWKAAALQDVDFWKLKNNPFMLDFIYVLPMWTDKSKRISNDFFSNIAYTYNLSNHDKDVLKWWIKQGGYMWLELGIFATGYETYQRDVIKSNKAIVATLKAKSKNMHFLKYGLKRRFFMADRVDIIKTKPKTIRVKATKTDPYFSAIKNIGFTVDNFIESYFVLRGTPLINDQYGHTWASYVDHGDGKIVSLYPFEYTNRSADGELLRWKLLMFCLQGRLADTNQAHEQANSKQPMNQSK